MVSAIAFNVGGGCLPDHTGQQTQKEETNSQQLGFYFVVHNV